MITRVSIFISNICENALKKRKDISITGREGLQGCEMLKSPHCIDKQLTDGGKVVSPTHRPRSTPQEHYFSASDTHHFSFRLSKPQVLVRPE
jgi:hypothetical protein